MSVLTPQTSGRGVRSGSTGEASTGRSSRTVSQLAWGLAFISPNVLGFLAFTTIPLVLSLIMAFTDWNLTLHNPYAMARDPDTTVKFVGLDNFIRLLTDRAFWVYLLNTLYMMLGLPFGIAASLLAAMMLSKNLRGASGRVWVSIIATAAVVGFASILAAAGLSGTAMVMLLASLATLILLGGAAGGTTIYRTLFYVPHFTAGVATLLLWKKLYNPETGPINAVLSGPLLWLDGVTKASPVWWFDAGAWVGAALTAAVAIYGLNRLRRLWSDGELGWAAAVVPAMFIILPAAVAVIWWSPRTAAETGRMSAVLAELIQSRQGGGYAAMVALAAVVAAAGIVQAVLVKARGAELPCRASEGSGNGLMLGAFLMVVQFLVLGLAAAWFYLPYAPLTSSSGIIEPPKWLNSYEFAKPAIILIGFWGAVGSNTMLLYLAALTNVPQELYEASDIDGASRFQKFWNVTWPQLAPTTFFVVVMGVMGGLQGGFETARVLTQGGPAGSTTTIAYFIYAEGFETGRLGFSSAVAWTLFLMVLAVTLFNWKFGNRYVND